VTPRQATASARSLSFEAGAPWVSAAGWAAIGVVIALVEAAAVTLDTKLGFAVAVAFVAAALVTARPVLLLPIGLVTVNLENLTFNDVAATRLLAPGMLLVVLAELLRGGARIQLGAPFWCVGGYVAWAVASGLWTESVEGTRFLLQSLAIALIFMLAFASLLNSERDLRVLLYVFAFASALLGGLSVIAFGGNLEIPHLELLQGGRSQGGVGDPDFFAAIQLVAVPLVLVLAGETQSRHLRLVLYGALLTILASVFTSLSRGAFLATAVLALLLLISRPERVFRSRQEKAAALLVIALGMTFFFSRPFVREEVVTRAESIYAPKTRQDETGSGRTVIWSAAKRTAAENPILGVGFGSFIYISEELILNTPNVDLTVYKFRGDKSDFVAHNTYLGTAAELGLVGLVLYLGVLFSTALHLRRTTRRAFAAGKPFVGRVANALVIGLAAWAVTSIFLSGETARMFWIIVGLSLALPKLLPPREPEPAG
jgi:putative inorganic carbon (hco3(-)) transporter